MSGGRSTPWLARTTNQFARTVYTELRRAQHGHEDIVRFINELMDLLSRDVGTASAVEPPALLDPEAGLPDRETIQEVLEFELRRARQDRRQERLVVVAVDILLPGWTPGAARQHSHELLARAMNDILRASDSMGHLGRDRYLMLLAHAKEGAVAAVSRRLAGLLDTLAAELPDGLTVELRSVINDPAVPSAGQLLELCFARPPQVLAPRPVGVSRPVARSRAQAAAPDREVVLALGGGAARAASHAGVMAQLEQAQVRAVGVAGCSAGGMVGAMSLRGMGPQAVIEKFSGFAATPIYREMRRAYGMFLRDNRAARRGRNRYFGDSSLAFYSENVLSAVSTELLYQFVEYFVGPDCDMRSLPVPFSVVATDLIEGRPVVISHGSLHAGLAASCAVPGLFPPQRVGDRLLVDGSTVTEVPIWAGQLLGVAAPVLAVYMNRPTHRIVDFQNSAEVATRSNALVHAELVREQLGRAEYLISVPMHEIGWLDFRQAERIARVGREAAHEALPRILERMALAPDADQEKAGGG
jgi:NTE family protein